jgi:hypothetical protein
MSYVIVDFYDGIVSESNPLGLSAFFPKNCREITSADVAAPSDIVMTREDYLRLKEDSEAEFVQKRDAYIAALRAEL